MFTLVLRTVLGIYFLNHLKAISADREDASLTVPEILSKYGYPNEVHYVTTSDSYILALHRIPHGKNNATVSNKPVLVLHGVLVSSDAFVSTGADHGLGYMLADEGYDVWLGDVRGVEYSRNHTTLNPNKDEKFWDFTLHEMGTIDLPAMVDHVLEVTHQPSLYYVGYSQGATIFFIMMATQPEYNAKIKVHVAMAPAVYLKHMQSIPVKTLAYWNWVSNGFFREMKEFPSKRSTSVKKVICRTSSSVCNYAFIAIFGYKPSDVNLSTLTPFLAHFPVSTSRKQIGHFLQIIKSGFFRRYDYGRDNVKVYGSLTPPLYDMSHITTKSHLFYSHDDQLVSETDVGKLCEEIGDACSKKYLITNSTVKHLDWLMGKRIRELVYSKVVRIMGDY